MPAQMNQHWGAQIRVKDPQSAAQWLRDHLFFTSIMQSQDDSVELDNLALVNGNCQLKLVQGENCPLDAPVTGQYYTGLAHIALRTNRIDEAISWCLSHRLELQLDGGKSFYNPKVFGGGERFFNIISPFGIVFEVSQRVDVPSACEEPLICGLDHLGLPSPDLEVEMSFFRELGFVPEFEPVTNWNPAEGTIYCCMLSQADPGGQVITLEIYQFADWKPLPMPEHYGLDGLVLGMDNRRSPGGVRLIRED